MFEILSRSTVIDSVLTRLDNPGAVSSTGMPNLDKAMYGGMYAGVAYGIQARKKVGKTILMGTISHNLNIRGTKHLFITGEMGPAEIERRTLAREMGFNSGDFLKGLSGDRVESLRSHQSMAHDNALYCHAPGVTMKQLELIIRKAREDYGIKGVIMDYLQLIRGDSDDRTAHLEYAAQMLANTARLSDIWVLAAAQLNQEGNTRGGEGLKLAFDQVYTLHRDKTSDEAWLEMEESRYTSYMNIGSKASPGLKLEMDGPYFREM